MPALGEMGFLKGTMSISCDCEFDGGIRNCSFVKDCKVWVALFKDGNEVNRYNVTYIESIEWEEVGE